MKVLILTEYIVPDFAVASIRWTKLGKYLKKLDRLRSSVKLSCNQLFLDVFKVVDHTLPGLVSTAD